MILICKMAMSVEAVVGYYNQVLIFVSSLAANLKMHFSILPSTSQVPQMADKSGRYRFTSGAKTVPVNKSAMVISFTINL